MKAITISCLLLLASSCTIAFQNVARPSFRRTTSIQSSLVTELSNGYNTLLNTYPLATQMVTASVLAGVGDALAQIQQEEPTLGASVVSFRLLDKPKQIDLDRLRRFMLKGLGGGVIWSFWFALNDQWTQDLMTRELWVQDESVVNLVSLLGGASTESTPVAVAMGRTLLSILLEQFIAVPLIYTFWDIPVPTLLSDTQENESIPSQVQQKLPALLVDNAKVWTVVNLAVYNAPLQYRVLVSSVADIVWQSILSGHVMTDSEDVLAKQDEPLLDGILGPTETTSPKGVRTGKVTL